MFSPFAKEVGRDFIYKAGEAISIAVYEERY